MEYLVGWFMGVEIVLGCVDQVQFSEEDMWYCGE